MDKLNASQALFDLFLWGVIFFTLYPAHKFPYKLPKFRRVLGILLIFLFCLFPFFGGDYFHYMVSYEEAKFANGYYHIEDVYVWIVQNICNSYLQFRVIVWGSALLLTVLAYKRLVENTDLPLFYLGVFYLPWFAYARVSLAMALIFFGLSLLAKPLEHMKKLSCIMGLGIMFSSLFFHRSAVIGIIAALGSLLLSNPKKRTVVQLVVFFPLILIVMKTLLGYFMNLDLSYDDYISGRQRDTYLYSESHGGLSMGLGPYLSVFFTRAPLFIVALTYIYYVSKGFMLELSRPARIVSSYSFLVFLIAFAFMFDLGFNTYTLYYRTLSFAMIPAAVFLSQVKKTNRVPNLYNIVYWTTGFGVFYTLLYSVYAATV